MYFLLFIATAIIIFSCIEGSARTKRNLNLLNKINKKLDILMGKIATMKIMKSIKDEHPDIDE